MKIKIEGDGHMVEIDHSDIAWTVDKMVALAEDVWTRTKQPSAPRQQIGFAGQSIERRGDRHPGGDPMWHSGNEPTTA